MANTLKPKRSNTVGKDPTTSDLVSGELGVNMADQKIWIHNGTSVVQIGAGKLSKLADVTLTSLQTDDVIKWDGSKFINAVMTGGPTTTDGLTEGTTNLYFTQARARSAISATQNISYNSTTGILTGPDLSAYLTSATAASTYQTQSSMSSYLTTTAAAAAYLALSGGTLTGDLTFSGDGRRIKGDMSNATATNRLSFQTSTADTFTIVNVLPSGTGTTSQWRAHNSSDPANSSIGIYGITSAALVISSTNAGTGSYLPISLQAGGAQRFEVGTSGQLGIGATPSYGTAGQVLTSNGPSAAPSWTTVSGAGGSYLPLSGGTLTGDLTFSGTARRILGDMSNGTVASRLMFQTTTANSFSSLEVIPNGSSQISQLIASNSSDPTNSSGMSLTAVSDEVRLQGAARGTGAWLPLAIYLQGAKRWQFGIDGQLGIGATPNYGTAGQVLTSNGPSAAPSWTTGGGGGGISTGKAIAMAMIFGG